MTVTLGKEEIERLCKNLTDKSIKVSFGDYLIIETYGQMIKAKVTLTLRITPEHNLEIVFAKATVGGINMTAFIRGKVFDMLKEKNCVNWWFELKDSSIILHVKNIDFKEANYQDNLTISPGITPLKKEN